MTASVEAELCAMLTCTLLFSLRLWDYAKSKCTATLSGHNGPVRSVAVKNGKAASASDDTTVKLWDLGSKKCTATLEGHKGGVNCVAISGNGTVASGSSDMTCMCV